MRFSSRSGTTRIRNYTELFLPFLTFIPLQIGFSIYVIYPPPPLPLTSAKYFQTLHFGNCQYFFVDKAV